LMSLVLFLTGGMIIMPVSAFGLVDTAMSDEAASIDNISTLQAEVERSGQAYDDASERLQNIQNDLSQTNARIAELEKLLPQQEEQSNEAIVILYKYRTDNSTFIDMLFSASSFSEVMKVLQYFGYLNESNLATIAQTKAMKEELETSRSKLEADQILAEQAKQGAAEALASAQAARIESQRRADEKIASELAAATQAGTSASAPAAVSAATDTNESVNWATDKSTFINEWAARIDDYLSGSPLSGYGRTFAEAAYDYGVDPCWSPAIATIESSKGAAGSLARNYYNAWGWGSKHFSSWDESIPQHVAYLARKYGGALSPDAAQIYCPSSPEEWYASCRREMNKI